MSVALGGPTGPQTRYRVPIVWDLLYVVAAFIVLAWTVVIVLATVVGLIEALIRGLLRW